MTRIDTDKYPRLKPLQDAADATRAIDVMKRHGCYVVPGDGGWRLRTKDGYDFPLGWLLEQPRHGTWDTPEAALLAAGEWLDAREEGGE